MSSYLRLLSPSVIFSLFLSLALAPSSLFWLSPWASHAPVRSSRRHPGALFLCISMRWWALNNTHASRRKRNKKNLQTCPAGILHDGLRCRVLVLLLLLVALVFWCRQRGSGGRLGPFHGPNSAPLWRERKCEIHSPMLSRSSFACHLLLFLLLLSLPSIPLLYECLMKAQSQNSLLLDVIQINTNTTRGQCRHFGAYTNTNREEKKRREDVIWRCL